MIPHEKIKVFVTAKIWHEVEGVVFDNFLKMTEVINENIELSTYGNEVKFFTFVFVILRPTNPFEKSYIYYEQAEKAISLQYRIPYEEIANATLEENLPRMAFYFLEALEFFYDRNPKSVVEASDEWEDFDFAQFKKDVESLFEEEGWLVGEMV